MRRTVELSNGGHVSLIRDADHIGLVISSPQSGGVEQLIRMTLGEWSSLIAAERSAAPKDTITAA